MHIGSLFTADCFRKKSSKAPTKLAVWIIFFGQKCPFTFAEVDGAEMCFSVCCGFTIFELTFCKFQPRFRVDYVKKMSFCLHTIVSSCEKFRCWFSVAFWALRESIKSAEKREILSQTWRWLTAAEREKKVVNKNLKVGSHKTRMQITVDFIRNSFRAWNWKCQICHFREQTKHLSRARIAMKLLIHICIIYSHQCCGSIKLSTHVSIAHDTRNSLAHPTRLQEIEKKKFRKFSTWHRRAADDDDIDLVQVQAEAQSPSWWDDDEVVWNLISLSPLLLSSTCLFDSTFTCYRSCMPYTSTRQTKTTHHNMKISPFFISSLLMSEVLCLLLVWNLKKHVNFFREAEAEN